MIGSRIGPIDLPVRTHAKVPSEAQKPWAVVRDRIGDEQRFPWRAATTELPASRT